MADQVDDPIDGRHARRERNRLLVLDAVLEMFNGETMLPSVDAVAERSGLSLRSLYRYFEDQDELIRAAIERNFETTAPLLHLHEIGRGSLGVRIDRFVDARLRAFEKVAPTFRATMHHAPLSPQIREALITSRRVLREQVELQFAPELERLDKKQRQAVAAACDMLTQFDTLDLYRRSRGFTVAETKERVSRALATLLRAD